MTKDTKNNIADDRKIMNAVDTLKCKIYLREDGIMCAEMKIGQDVFLEDAIEIIDAQKVVAAGIKRPLLVISKNTKSMSRDARNYLGGTEAEKIVNSTAVIVKTKVETAIASFFLGLNKSKYPLKMFTSTENGMRNFRKLWI